MTRVTPEPKLSDCYVDEDRVEDGDERDGNNEADDQCVDDVAQYRHILKPIQQEQHGCDTAEKSETGPPGGSTGPGRSLTAMTTGRV